MTELEVAVALCGLGVSAVGTLIGVGGGFLMVPILRLACGVPMHLAIACSLVAIFPAALYSTILNYRKGRVDVRVAVALEVAAMITAVGGAHVAHVVPGPTLRTVFGFVVGGLGLHLIWKFRKGEAEDETRTLPNRIPPFLECEDEGKRFTVSATGVFCLGGVAGFLAGLLGIGGGFLKSPALIHVFGMPARTAAATSLSTVMVTAFVGGISHYRLGHLEPRLGGIMIVSFFLGAMVGNVFDRRVDERARRRLISVSLLLAGAAMLCVPR